MQAREGAIKAIASGWRTTLSGSVSEAQARENAAPLTTAILEPARRNDERRG